MPERGGRGWGGGGGGCSWGGGAYRKHGCVGVCDPLPKTLTQFITKIDYFPYPIYDLTVAAGTVTLNIIYKGLLMMFLSIMQKSNFF